MTISLDAVLFDHQNGTATNDALTIRRNAAESTPLPEWEANVTVRPAQSVAAYAVEQTRGRTVAVRAAFSSLLVRGGRVEVRAVPPFVAPGANAVAWLPRYEYGVARALVADDVLGELGPAVVEFDANGRSGYVDFELVGSRLSATGVGAHFVAWRWQARAEPGGQWVDIAGTTHTVYTVLDLPTAPWHQRPGHDETQLPWSDVLDYACRWASGARTLDEAATLVTRAVNGLGPFLLAYDCPGGGITHYTVPILNYFSCTEFIERLRGGIGNGYYLNCTDCASVVSTFANALGCDLWQSTMGAAGFPFFALNPVLAIGSTEWRTACGWGALDFHEVAWKGDCGADNEVFDACLKLDDTADPRRPPFVPVLPANMRFGGTGEGLYRDRLAAPSGRRDCEPQPRTRQRRRVI